MMAEAPPKAIWIAGGILLAASLVGTGWYWVNEQAKQARLEELRHEQAALEAEKQRLSELAEDLAQQRDAEREWSTNVEDALAKANAMAQRVREQAEAERQARLEELRRQLAFEEAARQAAERQAKELAARMDNLETELLEQQREREALLAERQRLEQQRREQALLTLLNSPDRPPAEAGGDDEDHQIDAAAVATVDLGNHPGLSEIQKRIAARREELRRLREEQAALEAQREEALERREQLLLEFNNLGKPVPKGRYRASNFRAGPAQ